MMTKDELHAGLVRVGFLCIAEHVAYEKVTRRELRPDAFGEMRSRNVEWETVFVNPEGKCDVRVTNEYGEALRVRRDVTFTYFS
jgi:hypothetical protein